MLIGFFLGSYTANQSKFTQHTECIWVYEWLSKHPYRSMPLFLRFALAFPVALLFQAKCITLAFSVASFHMFSALRSYSRMLCSLELHALRLHLNLSRFALTKIFQKYNCVSINSTCSETNRPLWTARHNLSYPMLILESQEVSMPSFMPIGPKLRAWEGSPKDHHTSIILLHITSIGLFEYVGKLSAIKGILIHT